MRPRTAEVAEQLGVGAAGVLQGVGENWKAIEGVFVVDQLRHSGCGGRSPLWGEGYRSEGIAENVAEKRRLNAAHGLAK
jgi:hypothetical protein